MDQWIENNIKFVIRMRDRALATIIGEFSVPDGSHITRDAKVYVGSAFRSMKHLPFDWWSLTTNSDGLRIFISVWIRPLMKSLRSIKIAG
ncbi:hypothetical protein [Paenibacillus bouchesdurhonensis]|uniref:hypothetical protein n=1 Tax=Paenibacillus bouchesdurhonensis TaxID=1870990 RepID=UPI0018FFAA59|nr:hypothetical protein [Paenibacillus bouchesdurhonensis]